MSAFDDILADDESLFEDEDGFPGVVVAVWMGSPQYLDADGQPLPLARFASEGGALSFEALVAGVNSDIRSRVVLDEWLRLGVASIDDAGRVQLVRSAFVPSAGLSEIADDLKNSTDIAKSAEEVASAAEQLSSAVQEINRSAGQIMVALEQIRKGAQTQAAATTESAAAITQIEKGAQLAEERASQARDRAGAIRGLLGENKGHIDQMVASISSGVDSTRQSMQQIKDLELVSRKIDKIVDAITQVSIQTNMLAVNGSIEAARAGEYGKGFVVVATDIRNLAHDSAENADRIKDLVKSIQDQIGTVGRDLSEIMGASLAEVEKAKSITGNLESMEADVVSVEKGNAEAVNASQEIVTALSQVKIAVDQVSSAAQEAEKAAEQATTAAKQQSQGAEELSAAIEEISSLADELQSN